eukprot:CAMPEP_0119108346 /NCGR_PEP_ID=MMETSP1180-20130426/13853_2 /TAXON_ID=3052 ORGANISM="Chlamydomonas cf sp, Strain CCMP681" /NCGR_SAMPLE_ID=MMETSP1180 /ASSEMBLY_ACC=CAM_ASM_000741 /LENGTH=36 /DNA_ID= /DNA_START= /DNA_END= /DNA_ORIENTATION=
MATSNKHITPTMIQAGFEGSMSTAASAAAAAAAAAA